MGQKSIEYPLVGRKWLSRAEAAGYLGIGLNKFDDSVRRFIPENIELGDPRFELVDIDDFMRRNKRDADTIMAPKRRAA